jgi:hypothetical protein
MTANTKRPLEIIADDIRALERGNAFAIGALLVEARDDAGYGEWAEWLESEFDWSEDTARNYMAAHRLAEQFRTVRNLPLPMTTFYRLGNDFELDDPDLSIFIEALTDATRGKSKVISVAEANAVIDVTLLRIEHGDYPDATLNGLASLGPEQPWTETAIAKLKAERPITEEAADQLVVSVHRAHVTSLYAGELPDDALGDLQDVPEKLRPELLQQLQAADRADRPLTGGTLFDIIRTLIDGDLDAERRKKTAARAVNDIADKAAERAAEEAAREAARAQQQAGATSSAEIERRLARAAEL